VPRKSRPNAFHPLIVALHGCTQNATDFAAGTQLDSGAERYNAMVVYPEQSARANPQRCWNWFLPEHQSRYGGEPAAVIALVDELSRRHNVDRSRVFVVGLSAGAALAAILAEQAPDVFAGVGMVAGVPLHASHDVPTAFRVMRGRRSPDVAALRHVEQRESRHGYGRMRVAIWAGSRDETVAPENAGRLAEQFALLLGLRDTAPVVEPLGDGTVTRWADASGAMRIELRMVAGLGHAWSGGSFRGSHTAPTAPNATDAMLEFFMPAAAVTNG